jgi:hypothetical protein
MFLLNSDPSDPYVPFVTGRHSPARVHETRRRESAVSRPRRLIGRALVRAGRTLASR